MLDVCMEYLIKNSLNHDETLMKQSYGNVKH